MMKDYEVILGTAIDEAIEGGWPAKQLGGPKNWNTMSSIDRGQVIHRLIYMGIEQASQGFLMIIFDPEFCKALWGDGYAWFTEGQSGDTLHSNSYINWKGHIANMAVTDDRLEYLRRNIRYEAHR